MKKIIWRVFANYRKEENWLNKMSSQGFALTGYSPFRYVFESCEPGEYIYRIELLENISSSEKSRGYLEFMREAGVEYIGSHFRWVFFRKKAVEGPFDIYSDIDSRIAHFRRIACVTGPLMIMELCIGLPGLIEDLMSIGGDGFLPHLVIHSFLVVVALLLFTIWFPAWKNMRLLKKERQIRE